MKFHKTWMNDVYLLKSEHFSDERGFFQRLFCRDQLDSFVSEISQVNRSYNKEVGTVRGMHYQISEAAETKIVWCVSGAVFDVLVDVRPDSPTRFKHFSVNLVDDENCGVIVPKGFAHGFQVLAPDTTLIYFHDEKYNPDLERRLNPLDPKLNIQWPLKVSCISEKDKTAQWL